MPKNYNNVEPVLPGAVYLTTNQLLRRYGGLTLNWLKKRLKEDPDFPRPFSFSEKGLWLFKIEEVEAYERAKVAAHHTKSAPKAREVA